MTIRLRTNELFAINAALRHIESKVELNSPTVFTFMGLPGRHYHTALVEIERELTERRATCPCCNQTYYKESDE